MPSQGGRMDADDHKVEAVLKEDRRFIVPLYQRKYRWAEHRLLPFWEDVQAKAAEVLVGALRTGSPSAREFAAQALVLFAEPAMKPALDQALANLAWGVRIHAIQALGMLAPLPRSALASA